MSSTCLVQHPDIEGNSFKLQPYKDLPPVQPPSASSPLPSSLPPAARRARLRNLHPLTYHDPMIIWVQKDEPQECSSPLFHADNLVGCFSDRVFRTLNAVPS
eukprot:493259-Heterocapsa_arctica.AAC.1